MKKLSAGVLVYRLSGESLEVFLVHPGGPFFARKDVWGIPKGEYQDGEDPFEAAKREFYEETGQPAPEGEYLDLGEIKRKDGKIIKAYAAKGNPDAANISSNTFELEWPRGSGNIQNFPEVDKAKWMPLGTAKQKVHLGQEVFLDKLAEILDVEIIAPPSQQKLL